MMGDKRLVNKNSFIGHEGAAHHPEYREQTREHNTHQKSMDER
jgi:hypothetical protein